MKGLLLSVFALAMLTASAGEGQLEQLEQLEQPRQLECFRCDLGFWDACFTTKTNCSTGEKCYTGRGKAGDVLDIKMLGCVKAEECEIMTSVELFSNNSIYMMTKSCCDTNFCNAAQTLHLNTLLYLTMTTVALIHLTAS